MTKSIANPMMLTKMTAARAGKGDDTKKEGLMEGRQLV